MKQRSQRAENKTTFTVSPIVFYKSHFQQLELLQYSKQLSAKHRRKKTSTEKKKQIWFNNKNLRNQIRVNKQHPAFSIKRPKCFDSKRCVVESTPVEQTTKSRSKNSALQKTLFPPLCTRCWIRRPDGLTQNPMLKRGRKQRSQRAENQTSFA